MKAGNKSPRTRSGGEQSQLGRFSCLPQVKSLGRMIFDPIWAQKKHPAGSNELIHVVHGMVRVRMRGYSLKAAEGDTLIIPEGSWHRDDFDLSKGLDVFIVMFQWDAAPAFFRLAPPRKIPGLCGPVASETGKIFNRIQACLGNGLESDRLLIDAHLLTFLLLLLKQAVKTGLSRKLTKSESHRRRLALALRARRYIDEHYAEPTSLGKIAKSIGISAFYLSHIFGMESDFSLMEYITARRMQKALELIQGGNRNVSEVAYAVGYNDGNYFSKVFHRHHGISPSEALKNAGART